MPFVHRRPLGQPTRGKTAPNRLRRVDTFVVLYDPELVRRTDGVFRAAPFVDLGFGATPATTLESAARFRRLNPGLRVVGIEIDRDRVAAAQPFRDALTDFRLGGFNLPLGVDADGTPILARLIRAFNVLRQYEADAVDVAWSQMAAGLASGGLLVEGTSDPSGRLLVANVLRRTAAVTAPSGATAGLTRPSGMTPPLVLEALVFGTSFRAPFEPADFRAVLPKSLIHRMVAGEPIAAFFDAWSRAWQATRGEAVWGPRRHLAASVACLAGEGYRIDPRRRLVERGFVVWRAPGVGGDARPSG